MMKAFDCKQCGDCCYGKGGIVVTEDELIRISDFLNLKPEIFKKIYCEIRNKNLSIKTGENGFCVFFNKETQCTIHPVKPKICDLWPFFPGNVRDELNWKLAQDACPGINPDCSFEEFLKESRK